MHEGKYIKSYTFSYVPDIILVHSILPVLSDVFGYGSVPICSDSSHLTTSTLQLVFTPYKTF